MSDPEWEMPLRCQRISAIEYLKTLDGVLVEPAEILHASPRCPDRRGLPARGPVEPEPVRTGVGIKLMACRFVRRCPALDLMIDTGPIQTPSLPYARSSHDDVP